MALGGVEQQTAKGTKRTVGCIIEKPRIDGAAEPMNLMTGFDGKIAGQKRTKGGMMNMVMGNRACGDASFAIAPNRSMPGADKPQAQPLLELWFKQPMVADEWG